MSDDRKDKGIVTFFWQNAINFRSHITAFNVKVLVFYIDKVFRTTRDGLIII